MSRSARLRFAAISWLPLFSLVAVAQAQNTYNAATDWKSTFATSSAVASAAAPVWGRGNAWSAGVTSWNWTNQQAVVGNSSLQTLQTYYNTNTTGYLSSGTKLTAATYTYTVPFQTYQLKPGSTFNQLTGQTFTEQIASGQKPEKNGGFDSNAITLPSGFTSGGAASGYITEIGKVLAEPNVTGSAGFSTTADTVSGKYDDGDGSVQSEASGVFYNYGSNATSTSLAGLNMPASATAGTLSMTDQFGPVYVAWTAPQGGNVTVSTTATDLGGNSPSDGGFGFFVISTPSSANLAPGVLPNYIMTAPQNNSPGSGQISNGYLNSNSYSSTVAGSTFSTANPSWTSAYSSEGVQTLTWNSGSFYVTTGEVLYFVVDPGHDQYLTHGNHSAGSGTDGAAVSAAVTFTAVPEPSSVVLLGIAGVGLALAAWKRRRAA
jgi:hypothetical protein